MKAERITSATRQFGCLTVIKSLWFRPKVNGFRLIFAREPKLRVASYVIAN